MRQSANHQAPRTNSRDDWMVYADHLIAQDDPGGAAIAETLRSTAGNGPRWREAASLLARGIYLRADMLLLDDGPLNAVDQLKAEGMSVAQAAGLVKRVIFGLRRPA